MRVLLTDRRLVVVPGWSRVRPAVREIPHDRIRVGTDRHGYRATGGLAFVVSSAEDRVRPIRSTFTGRTELKAG